MYKVLYFHLKIIFAFYIHLIYSSDDESSDEEAHGQRNARHDEWPRYDRDFALAGMPWSNSVRNES